MCTRVLPKIMLPSAEGNQDILLLDASGRCGVKVPWLPQAQCPWAQGCISPHTAMSSLAGGMCPFRHISGEKTVVCKHWLRGLCKKGDQCEFLHEYDMTKMPECYFYSKFGKALQIGKVCHQVPATIHTHTPSISSPGEAPLRTKTERC